MTITHQHLQNAWDIFMQGDKEKVPADAFDQLYRAVSEICKRVDKIEAMINCAKGLDAEVEAAAQRILEAQKKGEL